MFVILTTKPGQYRTEAGAAFRPVESYDYLMFGRCLAHFVIAEQLGDEKVSVIDEVFPPVTNRVPAKFFVKYPTVERARAELEHLVAFGSMQTGLERVA
jgi:hypothetical protein